MKWEGQALLLHVRKFSEHAAILTLFTEENGIITGLMRGAMSRKHRSMLEPGNLLKVSWNARLEDQLGTLQCELLQPIAAFFMQDAAKLLALQSAMQLLHRSLSERDAHPALYRSLWSVLQTLKFGGDWWRAYIEFEVCLLSESGFGLELDHCAATGLRDSLTHVSPKSGRAVCAAAAAPYRHKLLPLPAFLSHMTPARATSLSADDIRHGLALTGYFIEHRIYAPHGWNLPPARAQLVSRCPAHTVPSAIVAEPAHHPREHV